MKNIEVHPLRQERLRRGWTQRELADFAQVSLSSVERAERGEPLRVDICKRLCECLNKKRPEELGLHSYGDKPETESDEMKRRQILQLGAMGASLLTTHQTLLHSETVEQIATFVRKPSHIDVKAIHSLGSITQSHWQLVYGGVPKRDLLSGVQGHLHTVLHFLQSTPMTPIEQQLCEVASQQAQILNEIYFDMHEYPKAELASKLAIDLAQRANNPALYAVALARMSFLYTYSHRFHEVLSLLQVARRAAEQAGDNTISCWIAAIEAEVQANIFAYDNESNAADASLKTLDRAERITGQAGRDIYWTKFGAASLAAYKGVCFKQLRKPIQAQIVLLQALNVLSKGSPGEQFGCGTALTDLAGAYAQQGEIEEACHRASQALHIISEQNKSANVLQRVCDFRLEVAAWAATSYVKDLDEQIALTRIQII